MIETGIETTAIHGARYRALEALSRLTATIVRATKADELYEAALQALEESISADRASVLLYDDSGVMRFRAWRRLSDEYRAQAEGHSPWPRDVRDPQVIVVPDAEADEGLASFRPAFQSEGIGALAFIPLVARETLLGKFMVYWEQPHQLDDVEMDAVCGIADRVAHGIDKLQTADALRASRDQLRTILHGIADGVTVQDRDGSLVFANPAAAKAVGAESPEELLAAPPARIIDRFELFDEHGQPLDPGDLPGRRALRGETPDPTLVRFRPRDGGSDRWSIVSSSPVLDESGAVRMAINIFRDVTAAQEATIRERFLAAIGHVLSTSLDFEQTLASVARLTVPTLADWCRVDVVDPDGQARPIAIEHHDPAMVERAREVMNRYPEPAEQSGIVRVIKSGTSELYPVITDEMVAAGSHHPEHLEFLRRIGVRSAILVPLKARGRTIAALTLISTSPGRRYSESDLAFAEDVAGRAALALDNALLFREEQESRRREEASRTEAEAANNAKDEFLATLSHELRTPLTAIVGWSRMLTTMPADPQLREDGLRAIARSAEAQTRIVDDLLDVSRIVTGKLQIVPRSLRLRDVVDAAVVSVRPGAEAKRITIEFVAFSDAIVSGDADRLQQVFWNLLSNAVRFTPARGTIRIIGRQDSGEVSVTVSDTGSGIRPEFLPFVFDRFRQGDGGPTRAHGGLGLGLAIVRSLTELHGGSVRAESEGEGRGASFTVTLPLSGSPEEVAAATPSKAQTLAGRRVLLVEDDAETRGFLGTLLESVGADVRSAADVPGALSLFAEWQPHVVVTDIAMPGDNGYDLVRRLREREDGVAVPAIALTAYGRAEDRDRALEAGFSSFLRKPIDPAVFIDVVAVTATAGVTR